MYQLIKKDIILQKKNLVIYLLLILFFSFWMSSIGSTGLTYSIFAVSYLLAVNATAFEEKNNSDIILLSLPIRKQKIVLAKYISVYVYIAIATLANFSIYILTNLLSIPFQVLPFTFEGIILASVGVTLLCSITFPLVFKLGYNQSKMFNNVLFFLTVFVAALMTDKLILSIHFPFQRQLLQFFSKRTELEIIILLLVPVLFLFIISFFSSLRFYKRREF